MSVSFARTLPVTLLLLVLSAACSRGGDGGSRDATTDLVEGLGTVGGTVAGLPPGESVSLALNGGAPLVVAADGTFSFPEELGDGATYSVAVTTQPAGAYCVVGRGTGGAFSAAAGVQDVAIRCDVDPATPLFDTSRVHRLRLTVSVDEWNAFTLGVERSRYVTNAHGVGKGQHNLRMVSEVYRRGTLEVLDDAGAVTDTVKDVGFRMRGAQSRLRPEETTLDEESGVIGDGRPRRFHVNIKFDEDFAGDESVYACVDGALAPAAVRGSQCLGRLAEDVPPIATDPADPARKMSDRTFRGLESLQLKFNKDDPGYVREALAYAVLNDRGVLAGRAAHASLELVVLPSSRTSTLYGRALPQSYEMGVYTMLEPVDKRFLERRFGEGKNGFLFKVTGDLTTGDDLEPGDTSPCVKYEARTAADGHVNPDFCTIGVEQPDPESRQEWLGPVAAADPDTVNMPVNFPYTRADGSVFYHLRSQFAPYRPTYDLKTKKKNLEDKKGKEGARTALTKLIQLVRSEDTTLAQLEQVFDVDAFIRQQAVELSIGAVDHFTPNSNNYYVYQDPDTMKWSMLTYDFDYVFRDTYPEYWGGDLPAFHDVLHRTPFTGGNTWGGVVQSGKPNRLYDLVMSSEANRAKLLAEVGKVRRDWLDWDRRTGPVVHEWLDRLEPFILRTTAANAAIDIAYERAAAEGESFTYRIWVDPDNRRAKARGGPLTGGSIQELTCTETVKNFVRERTRVLEAEAP